MPAFAVGAWRATGASGTLPLGVVKCIARRRSLHFHIRRLMTSSTSPGAGIVMALLPLLVGLEVSIRAL